MNALILMTRIPIPGKTKTRLMNILSPEECAQIHKCFLLDIFNSFEYIKNDLDIFLTYTPENSLDIIKDLIPKHIKCFPQHGYNLGERMLNAINHILNKGYSKVVLMGSDIPQIYPNHIRNTFLALDSSDIAIGPTLDGGYYLIGMKKIHKDIFNNNLKWGNKSVFEETIDMCNKLNLKVELCEKYMDIDTKEDLVEFRKTLLNKIKLKNKVIPENTMRFLDKHWSDDKDAQRYIK